MGDRPMLGPCPSCWGRGPPPDTPGLDDPRLDGSLEVRPPSQPSSEPELLRFSPITSPAPRSAPDCGDRRPGAPPSHQPPPPSSAAASPPPGPHHAPASCCQPAQGRPGRRHVAHRAARAGHAQGPRRVQAALAPRAHGARASTHAGAQARCATAGVWEAAGGGP